MIKDYGMLGVLLLLALFFSVLTLDEQPLTGGPAARALAVRLEAAAASGVAVLIAIRPGEDDARFAGALAAELARRTGRSPQTVVGDPTRLRQTLERLALQGASSLVIATTDSYAPVVRSVLASVPDLGSVSAVTPPSYRWPTFLLAENLRNVANQIAVIAILAIGMTLVILTGGIDLSVGSQIALSAVVVASIIGRLGGETASAAMVLLAACATILLCGLTGAFSALMIVSFRVPPFIATLALMQVASGLAYILSEGKPVYQLPAGFPTLGRGSDPLLGLPWAVLLMFALYAAAHLLMSRTTLGRYIYAVGGNAEAARLAGVRVGGVLVFAYVACGMLAGLGGIVMASQLRSGAPTYGLMYELYVIAAVVVGGTSLAGGEGRVLGTLIGAFIIAVIQNGMNLTHVESYTQKVMLGLVILGAVMLDRLKHRRWGRRAPVTLAAAVLAAAAGPTWADEAAAPEPERQVYVVATAHLDTQWRWTVRDTIEKFLPATLHDNFALFEKYPGYTFSFEGAFRYMLMKEYYPAEYNVLKRYIAAGRWRVAGSWVDAVDTNVPSPESLIRQGLYGNGFFRREFGLTSRDVYLPDCFGFGFALPTVAAHLGLSGFSTQKLTWGSSIGVPFDVGLWEGVDGSTVVAALNPGDYVSRIDRDLSQDAQLAEAIDALGKRSGVYAAYRYFGTGDQGGAPDEGSVEWLQKSLSGRGPVKVRSTASDQLARDLTARRDTRWASGLPRYRGEMLMTSHGAGCYTSQAAMKRANRKNERIADAAERAAVLADWLGGVTYPRDTLRENWVRVLWHQFHDDVTGTSIPQAYELSWNDEAIAQNQLAGILDDAVGVVTGELETSVQGVPLVVYNPLSIPREDIVEASVSFGGEVPRAVRVFGPDGREVPSQLAASGGTVRVLFLASAPSVGFSVYEVRATNAPAPPPKGLSVSTSRLENARYRVTIDSHGDIASVFDKRGSREMLQAPLQLQFLEDSPSKWPAWEVDYDDLTASPRAVAGAPAEVRVVESGPARVAVEVAREAEGSRIVQRIRLAAGGAGDRVEIDTDIDWRSKARLLKAAFPLAVEPGAATYDLGLGTIERGTNTPKLYEVPAQQWADLTAADGAYGVAILNDCKYGWDRPDANTLRLTLLHTPEVNENWAWVGDQGSMDLGHHHLLYALSGHRGDWREGAVSWEADRLNQPLRAWQAPRHGGALGRSFSLASIRTPRREGTNPSVAIRALKMAEESDEIVVRLVEIAGRETKDARLSFARPIVSVREVNGAEEPLGGEMRLKDGTLVASFTPYQPRAFALRLSAPPVRVDEPEAVPLPLPWNVDGMSTDGERGDGDFDGAGRSLASELLPERFVRAGIRFTTGPRQPGRANTLACHGQTLDLPPGDWNRVYIIAASATGNRTAAFAAGGARSELWIDDYAEPVGQWFNRLVAGEIQSDPSRIAPAYLKTSRVAWIGTHRHAADGRNEAYTLTHLFLYRIDLPSGTRTIRLPDDEWVRIVAMTAARNEYDAIVSSRPSDELPAATLVRVEAPHRNFLDSVTVSLGTPTPRAVIHYTLDGSVPTEASPIASAPLTIQETATLKARAMAQGMDDGFIAEAHFTRLALHDAVTPGELQPGLRSQYYEGEWSKLPDFARLVPSRQAMVPQVSIPDFARQEHFALALTGFLRIAKDGLYTFSLRSDDGSALYIGDEKVVDADGLHGMGDDRGDIALKAGMHPIRVLYFQRRGDRGLELWVEGPGIPMRQVSKDELFRVF